MRAELEDAVVAVESNGGAVGISGSYLRGPHMVFIPEGSKSVFGDSELSAMTTALARFCELKVLDLKNTDITDKSLPLILRLQTIEQLDISGTDITTDGVVKLSALSNLNNLTISEGQAGDVQKLVRGFPHVTIYARQDGRASHHVRRISSSGRDYYLEP
jgi:hypothetical protein